jgi:hypothetical protein
VNFAHKQLGNYVGADERRCRHSEGSTPQGLVQMRVIEDFPEPIYGLPISPRLIGNHLLDRSQRKRVNCVANRLGTDEFAESNNRRGISEVSVGRQILPQQILRHLDGIDDSAIGSHEAKRARNSDILARAHGLVVETLDFNIYATTNPSTERHHIPENGSNLGG